MRTLVLEHGKLAERDIENTLEALQGIVGGYIEIPFISERFANETIDIVINEEGKLINLEPQIAVLQRGTNRILDLIVGNCIFASHDEEGEMIGLTDEQIEIVKEELRREVIIEGMILKVLFV